MTYVNEAPDAVVQYVPLWIRNWNREAQRLSEAHHPVATVVGFDFYMNLFNHV